VFSFCHRLVEEDMREKNKVGGNPREMKVRTQKITRTGVLVLENYNKDQGTFSRVGLRGKNIGGPL